MTRAARVVGFALAFTVSGLIWWWVFSFLPSGGSTWRDLPPQRFQGNTAAAVVFTDERTVQRMCPHVRMAVGCTVGRTIYVPNPCRWGDAYATLLCHELGHVNGWSTHHER
jgi:hypothetical protein